MQDPVLVVGAGPVGLCASLALAAWGMEAVVVEQRPRLDPVGSRAIVLARHALEIFDHLACAEPMLARGIRLERARTFAQATELFCVDFPPPQPQTLPAFINLQQYYTEQALLEAVARSDLVSIHWNTRVEALRQSSAGIELDVAGPDGARSLRGSYAIGCDGARSDIRGLLGVEFPGRSLRDRFLIADIRADLGRGRERLFYFDPPFNPGRQVLVHPQPDSVWRIDWQVPASTDAEAERRSGGLERRLRSIIGEISYELVWLTSYRFHQRLARRLRSGRVFLAGDAAHLMSPFGARGLNSGVEDVFNLAWKLALVTAGKAPHALLDTYDTERREAARENLRVTGATTRFMVPPTRAHRLARDTILRASLYARPLRRFVNSGKLATPSSYSESVRARADALERLLPAGGDRASGPRRALRKRRIQRTRPEVGSAAPDVACVVTGTETVRVRSLCRTGFVALCFFQSAQAAAGFARKARHGAASAPVRLLVVAPSRDSGSQAVPELVPDPGGELARAYGAGQGEVLYLLRPDGHIAARRFDPCPADVAALARWAIGAPATVELAKPPPQTTAS